MKYWYKISKDNNIIFLNCKGKIKVHEFSKPLNDIISDPLFEKGMNTIADITKAEVVMGYEELIQFREYVKTIQDIRGPCKWAVITKKSTSYRMIKKYSTISKNLTIKTKVFSKYKDAIEWILSGSLN